jgi:hypothetical protein
LVLPHDDSPGANPFSAASCPAASINAALVFHLVFYAANGLPPQD